MLLAGKWRTNGIFKSSATVHKLVAVSRARVPARRTWPLGRALRSGCLDSHPGGALFTARPFAPKSEARSREGQTGVSKREVFL